MPLREQARISADTEVEPCTCETCEHDESPIETVTVPVTDDRTYVCVHGCVTDDCSARCSILCG